MTIGTAGDFTISFARDGYEPQTVTVHSTMSEGNYMTAPSPVLDPSPVYVKGLLQIEWVIFVILRAIPVFDGDAIAD